MTAYGCTFIGKNNLRFKSRGPKFSTLHRVYAWHTFLINTRKSFFMTKSTSLPDALQNLTAKGYHLADRQIIDLPDQSIQSNDWRLDSVQQVRQEQQNGPSSLVVIAVSSVHHRLKLVFVEAMQHKSDFSPMNLLRNLFPIFQK